MSDRAAKVLKYFEEQKDFVNARVASGIEQYRKGTVRIRVTDETGLPVGGAVIEAKQKTHAFRFGANLFMLDELETPEKNRTYRQKFPEIFNLATLPFYWSDLEPVEGKPRFAADSPKIYRRPPIDLCMDYCEEKGIEPKLHCLNYDQWSPLWTRGRSAAEMKTLLSKRFREIAERYASRIPMIEVTNETFLVTNKQGRADRCGSAFFDEDDFVQWSFLEAKKYFPENELVINEAGIWSGANAHTNRNPYYMQVKGLLQEGIPVCGMGLQFHSFTRAEDEADAYAHRTGRYNPTYLCAVLDKLGELNLPMQITEMTIPCYTDSPEDEEIQAEILRNVYSLLFAQQQMEAIIYWNVIDGYAYRAEPGDMTAGENYYRGGLLRFDTGEKPGWRILKKLIREDWTTDTRVVTDGDGFATLRGFRGDYDLNVHAGEKTVKHGIRIEGSRIRNVYLGV